MVSKQVFENNETLTSKELGFLMDTDFLITKSGLIKKIEDLLSETEKKLINHIKSSNYNFPEKILIQSGKISKGENYKLLPYLVLDYPRLNTKDNLLLYRTIFWWGNYFSYTLHLEGDIAKKAIKKIKSKAPDLTEKGLLIYLGPDRWSHDLSDPDYVSFDKFYHDNLNEVLDKLQFLKIAARSPLTDYSSVNENSVRYLKIFLSLVLD